jgi:predicted Zn-dependent protease
MLRASLSLAIPFLLALAGFAQTPITARVCDQIQIPAGKLARAENEAARILRTAGISVRWSDCNAPSYTSGAIWTTPVLRVQNLKAAKTGHHEIMGRAFIEGRRADVYYDEVQRFAHDFNHDRDVPTILAYVIVHELGHLLLGPEHSGNGVMEATWSLREVELMVRHELRFSSAECERLQLARLINSGM